jgi:hypothetical protein
VREIWQLAAGRARMFKLRSGAGCGNQDDADRCRQMHPSAGVRAPTAHPTRSGELQGRGPSDGPEGYIAFRFSVPWKQCAGSPRRGVGRGWMEDEGATEGLPTPRPAGQSRRAVGRRSRRRSGRLPRRALLGGPAWSQCESPLAGRAGGRSKSRQGRAVVPSVAEPLMMLPPIRTNEGLQRARGADRSR